MMPTLRPGSLCGTERFGAFGLLQLVYVAILQGWGWKQGLPYASATLPVLSLGPLRVSLNYPETLLCSVSSKTQLLTQLPCPTLPPFLTKTVASLNTADLRELMEGYLIRWMFNTIIKQKRDELLLIEFQQQHRHLMPLTPCYTHLPTCSSHRSLPRIFGINFPHPTQLCYWPQRHTLSQLLSYQTKCIDYVPQHTNVKSTCLWPPSVREYGINLLF